jgi:hypothetical protein
MTTFIRCRNNGVSALVREEDYPRLVRTATAGTLPPIFTFSTPDHPAISFMTGTEEQMNRLLAGHDVRSADFWVPFSNGAETSELPAERDAELIFRTTPEQVLEMFGRPIE